MGAMKPYVIRQGDYLKKIAHTLGFDAEAVWNDPKNAELKAARGKGDILWPGDILFIPDEPKPKHPFTAESDNAYEATVPKVEVKIKLELNGEPLPDEPYVLEGLGDDSEKKSDGDGFALIEAPVQTREVLLTLVKRGVKYRVEIGGVDPIDLPSGQRMRLKNLGYYGAKTGGEDGYEMHSEPQLVASLKSFQLEHDLEPTGIADDATKAALLEAHGS